MAGGARFLLLALTALSFTALAFVPLPPRCNNRLETHRQAQIYGEYYDDEHGTSCLEDTLSKEQVGALARVAAAFSPNALHLKDIQHVKVLKIDAEHLDIEAVVCEKDGCVTLAIPVSFPSPCSEIHEMEECVLDNVSLLDHHAVTRIEQMEVQEELQRAKDYWRPELLSHDQDLSFPDWWVHSNELGNECINIQSLLNGDEFAQEIRDLAAQNVVLHEMQYEYWEVSQAVISSVCPTGIFVRAIINFGTTETIRDILVRFSLQATTVENLRMLVLGTIADASGIVE